MIIANFGELEDKIGKYLKKDGMLFWGTQSVTYNDLDSTISITDDEAFPMGLGQFLNGVNSLLKNDDFKLIGSQPTESNYSINYINYAGSLAIENAYLNLLPSQFEKIKSIPVIFKDFNKKSINLLLIAVLLYSCVMIIAVTIYSIFLYITNKNMGEGLEKVTKIKADKIDETIKRIEGFNSLLKKFRDKDSAKFNNFMSNDPNNKTGTQTNDPNGNTNTGKSNYQGNSNNNNQNNGFGGFGGESKQHKSLKILTYSYFQVLILFIVLCAFLIPIYIISNSMVTSTNKLLNVQSYLFGKILVASASTVKEMHDESVFC